MADLGELPGFRRHAPQVVERHRLGDVLDQVEDVVHRGDQLVDLVAVDGSNEGLVQERDRLVRDLVRAALGVVDARARGLVVQIALPARHFDMALAVLDEVR